MVAAVIPAVLAMAKFAPSLLRFFGAGQASTAVADQVAGIAQAVTGAESPEAALAVMTANAKLAQEFNLRVLDADTDLEKAFLSDRADARDRDVKLAQAGQHNTRADVMVWVDALGLVACLVVLVFFRKDMPGEVVGLLSSIASIFGLCLRDAHQFEFGTSRGSRSKDEILAQLGAAGAKKSG